MFLKLLNKNKVYFKSISFLYVAIYIALKKYIFSYILQILGIGEVLKLRKS